MRHCDCGLARAMRHARSRVRLMYVTVFRYCDFSQPYAVGFFSVEIGMGSVIGYDLITRL